MSGHIETVKSRVILFLAMFTLIITLLALIFSFNIIYAFQKWSVTRSAESSLQLVANLIEQDLRELTSLGMWCGHNTQIIDYFLNADQPVPRSLNAWNRLSGQYLNNRASRYVRRLLVFNAARDKFLQVGNSLAMSVPVTIYNLEKIFDTGAIEKPDWQVLVQDPYLFSDGVLLLPFVYPVYNSWDGNKIGTVFLGAGTGIITDKLSGYKFSSSSQLYLEIGNNYFLIEDDRIIPGDFYFSPVKQESSRAAGNTGGNAAIIMEGQDSRGKRYTLVKFPVRDNIILTQVLEPVNFVLLSGAWPALAGGLAILIILLAIMVFGVNRMGLDIRALMDKAVTDEKNKRDLEYRMLQSQINPHFLYNTLNSIKWMATIQNAAGIAEMTTALSGFLKTLSGDVRRIVPLREELALLDDYMVIQKYRYGDSVNFEKQIPDESLLETPVPRFILQPLAENAIFHGIEPKGSGTILFSAARENNDVLVTLSDNGAGMDSNAVYGMGLNNINERLGNAFGEGYGIAISSEPGKGTTVTFRLPGNKVPGNKIPGNKVSDTKFENKVTDTKNGDHQ